ncbi:MAG: hypothetical protein M1835_006661, partial [Candelina submexicana]
VVEMNTGIICGCMPALKPLIRLVLPNLLGRTTAHTGTDSSRRSTGLKRSAIQSSNVTQDTYLELGEYAGNGKHVEDYETYVVGQENDGRERIIVGPDGGIMKTETVGVEVSRPGEGYITDRGYDREVQLIRLAPKLFISLV